MRTVATFTVATAIAAGCGRPHDARWHADSAAYEVKLATWLRDSAVVDSVSRTIDLTETIAALEAMVAARNPLDLEPRVVCQQIRLSWDYGDLAADAAGRRARDSVVRRHGRDVFKEAYRRAPERSAMEVRPDQCRGTRTQPLERIGETSLMFENPRPLPP